MRAPTDAVLGDPTATSTTVVVTAGPTGVPLAPLPDPSTGRREGRRVPAAYTAIEGTDREVARVPVWRKLVSLVTLLVILLVIGVVIAALAAAAIGTIAELVDGAVG